MESSNRVTVKFPVRWHSLLSHQKITRVFICRLTQHYTSYKALYDVLCFITLSAHVMLFKAYPTYICFLFDIFMFLEERIF